MLCLHENSRLEEVKYAEVEFDELAKGLEEEPATEMRWGNVGQIIALRPKTITSNTTTKQEAELRKSDSGILVGNTHLFWHLK